MLNGIINSQTKTIRGATFILALSALISAILGLFRDRLLAGYFGAGPETGIYFAAFRIPDLIYRILILGGVLVAFLPIFAEYFSESKEKAWEMTNYILNVFLFLLIVAASALFIFIPWLIKFIIPGLDIEYKDTAVNLTRLLFLSPILFGLSNIFSGVLHYFNRFLVYSLAPIFYNLGIIAGIVFLTPYFGIFGAALGVIFGAFLHLLIQLPSAINCGFRYRPLFSFKYPAVTKIFRLMLPRVFGVAAYQIYLIVTTALASLISTGSIAIFSFANNLQGLPAGVLGPSLAMAIFPTFSRLWVNGQKKEFIETFSSVLRQGLFLMVPLTVIFFILKSQIVALILGTGRFSPEDAQLTAVSLGFFSFSIFAMALIPYVNRAFFSLQDTITPTVTTLFSTSINIGFALIFMRTLNSFNPFSDLIRNAFGLQGFENIAVVGLALAFSIGVILQFLFLLIALYRKIGDYQIKAVWQSVFKIIFASFFMAGAMQLALHSFSNIFWQTIITAAVGVAVYYFSSLLLKSSEIKPIQSSILKLFNKNNGKY
jgi:putative peptidoglycan lipid II flippase